VGEMTEIAPRVVGLMKAARSQQQQELLAKGG
jgi:hypothetical protein